MTRILHRSIGPTLPHAASAQGVYITDTTGRRYLDASGGAAVTSVGHAHPEVLAAMRAQIDNLCYAHTSFFTTDAAEALAEKLVNVAPEGLNYVYLVSGGSEAVEAALKMARQYFVEI
ncbi:MAG: aminotransferase class III-fold pyridoxal phosphate-dependent enzyme, partial [Halomonas sp.]